jgi:hypothetical protein
VAAFEFGIRPGDDFIEGTTETIGGFYMRVVEENCRGRRRSIFLLHNSSRHRCAHDFREVQITRFYPD